jgi:hypothetical protein
MTLIRKGLGALKKPLKRRGMEEAEERGVKQRSREQNAFDLIKIPL